MWCVTLKVGTDPLTAANGSSASSYIPALTAEFCVVSVFRRAPHRRCTKAEGYGRWRLRVADCKQHVAWTGARLRDTGDMKYVVNGLREMRKRRTTLRWLRRAPWGARKQVVRWLLRRLGFRLHGMLVGGRLNPSFSGLSLFCYSSIPYNITKEVELFRLFAYCSTIASEQRRCGGSPTVICKPQKCVLGVRKINVGLPHGPNTRGTTTFMAFNACFLARHN